MAFRAHTKEKIISAQTAVEYLLLLMAVTIIVLLAFRTLLPLNRSSAEEYLNVVAKGVYYRPAVGNDVTGNWDKLRRDAYLTPGQVYP